jgi:2-oxoglutarate dehydrogenase dihydrolipoamide succinyltransferase (E2 component)
MATEVVMPQMGESIAEGTITKWLVKPGDKVERDQPLFEISTDKVDAEIPSPIAGTLLEIKAEEGQTVEVNAVVALIGAEGEKGDETAATAAAAPAGDEEEKGEATAEAEPEAQASGEAKGEEGGAEGAEETAKAEEGEEGEQEAGGPSEGERLRTFSSPLVRKIAREEGVDLTKVEGTGVHGRVTKKDIEAYLEQRATGAKKGEKPAPVAPARPAAAIAAPAPAPAAKAASGYSVPAYREGEEVEIEPMSKIREITAAHMRYSKDTSAHVTTVFHIDMTRVERARARAKAGFLAANGTKLTYMPFIFKAVATALRKHKKLNASIDGTNIVYKKHINLGMAVALDRGLVVPVLRDADQLSLVGLAKAANDLADRARTKKLGPDELQGGTFTITNPGVFGSLFGTPIINQPQVAILGIGTIEKRPVVVTDADGADMIAIRTMSYFGITYDHRLVDGADADHFMNDVKAVLEQDGWSELDSFR